MSKAYFFAIFLLAASFTGCIGGEDLEELTTEEESPTEEESNTEDDTLQPVGEENVTSLKKEIDNLKAKISDYEKPQVYFVGHNATSKIFCEDYEYNNDCYLLAKAFDVNGVIDRFSWTSSVANSINMSYDDRLCNDLMLDADGSCLNFNDYNDWFPLEICDDLKEKVNQTVTITVYDNDGQQDSASYYVDYDALCNNTSGGIDNTPIVTFFVEQSSSGVYHIEVIKVTVQVELEHFSFFLKDASGSTYIGGNGFGEIAMQMIGGEAYGIQGNYYGNNATLEARSNEISNDNGEIYPVHFYDNDMDGMLSAGDQFLVHGQGNGCDTCAAIDDWKLDIQYDPNGDIIGSAKLF